MHYVKAPERLRTGPGECNAISDGMLTLGYYYVKKYINNKKKRLAVH